ncbi:MAG TPA: SAM-dependent methyltransferase [Devosia sp.]|nr:SAM-dependent methyltransferase [Devosia sp.]
MKARRRQISTARGVALVRAIEMTRAPGERITADPYASRFVHPLSVHGMRLASALGISRLIGVEGLMNFALAREQQVTELIERELRGGARQIVVLGAGFDTRLYRLPEAAGVPVFEVDHPVTQEAKREALRGVVDPLPANVRFVGVDFDRNDLGERLRAGGYAETLRTLFVWQGVIMYLTPQGVDRTLRFISEHAASGSALVFDAMDREATSRGAIKLFTDAMGEKVTFGMSAGEMVPYLKSRGFTDVEIVDAEAMRRRHLGERPIACGVYLVTSRVR